MTDFEKEIQNCTQLLSNKNEDEVKVQAFMVTSCGPGGYQTISVELDFFDRDVIDAALRSRIIELRQKQIKEVELKLLNLKARLQNEQSNDY